MGASNSSRRTGEHRAVPVSKDVIRHHRQQQKPRQQPHRRRRSVAAQDSPHRVAPASESHGQGPESGNMSPNSDNIQGVNRRHMSSEDDGRDPSEGTEASHVTQAIKTQSIAGSDESESDVTCGLEAPGALKEPKASHPALPMIEEDECAICLEGYDEQNPRLLTQCEHHYHLQCILEWADRNHTCPICGRVAIFDENCVLQVYGLPVECMDQ